MALEKSKSLPNGTTGNYWKIIEEKFDKMDFTAECLIALFKDKATSNMSDMSLGLTRAFRFQCTREELHGNRTELLYTKIKAFADEDIPNFDGVGTHKGFPDLIGATDV